MRHHHFKETIVQTTTYRLCFFLQEKKKTLNFTYKISFKVEKCYHSDSKHLICDSSDPQKVKLLSRVWLFATSWTVAYQAPPSTRFPRQEYWSGLLFPSPGYLPNPGIEPGSPALEADALTSEPPGKGSPLTHKVCIKRWTWLPHVPRATIKFSRS